MRKCRKAKALFWLVMCLSALAVGQQPGKKAAAKFTPDEQEFRDANTLSRNGKHEEARKEFTDYQGKHPDDLLVPVRVAYDYLFDVGFPLKDKSEFGSLVDDMDKAIQKFELLKSQGCPGTYLAEGTLDCDYIGAALYSTRVVLRIKRDGGALKSKDLNAADDNQFFFYAHRSKSVQAQFLLGVHEYQASMATWLGVPAAWALKKFRKTPVDRDEGLRLIVASLKDQSPFVDDVWLFILDVEIENKSGADMLAKEYSSAAIIARLQPKYPNNRIFGNGLTSSFHVPAE